MAAVGVYGLAYTLGNIPYTMLLAPLHFVMYPRIVAWWEEGRRDAVRRAVEELLRYSYTIVVPAAVGLSLLARPVILLMSSPEFAEGQIVIPWISGAFVGMSLWAAGHYLLYVQKRTATATLAYALAGAANLLLNVLLVPRWGPVAAAQTTCAVYWLLAVAGCLYVRRSFPFSLQLGPLVRVVGACLPMGAVLWWLAPSGLGGVLGATALGTAVYLGALWSLGGIRRHDREAVRSLFGSRRPPPPTADGC